MNETICTKEISTDGWKEAALLGAILVIYQLAAQVEGMTHNLALTLQVPFAAIVLLGLCLGYRRYLHSNVHLFFRDKQRVWQRRWWLLAGVIGSAGLFWDWMIRGFNMYPPNDILSTGFFFPGPNNITLLVAVFIAPVAEEFFFRGLLLEHLHRHFGKKTGIILSSALFAMVHLGATNIGFTIFLFIASIGLCLLAEKSQSLLGPIVLHISWNCLVMGLRFPPESRMLAAGLVAIITTLFIYDLFWINQPRADASLPATEEAPT